MLPAFLPAGRRLCSCLGILGGLLRDSTAVSGVPGVFEGSGQWCKEFLGGHGFSPNSSLLLALGLISAKKEKRMWEDPGV